MLENSKIDCAQNTVIDTNFITYRRAGKRLNAFWNIQICQLGGPRDIFEIVANRGGPLVLTGIIKIKQDY